jgi:hypothetical protein
MQKVQERRCNGKVVPRYRDTKFVPPAQLQVTTVSLMRERTDRWKIERELMENWERTHRKKTDRKLRENRSKQPYQE